MPTVCLDFPVPVCAAYAVWKAVPYLLRGGTAASSVRFLLGLGALGILPPAASATLHNLSTLGVSLRSMTNLLELE